MFKVPAASLVLLTLLAAPAQALELKNLHAVYGPFGPARPDNKYVPGDALWVNFEIADIQTDPKTNMAKYHITVEQLDGKGGLAFKREKNDEVPISLGRGQLPAFADILIGTDQTPGKYSLKITVKDLLSKNAKDIAYMFEVQAETFAFVRAFSPVAGFTGQNHLVNFAVIGMTRDDKKKPSVEIQMRTLDEAGKPVHSQSLTIPKDLPDEYLSKIDSLPFVPLQYGLFLNRPGRFTIELEGTDNLGKKSAKLSFPLTVVDAASIGAK